MLSMNFYWKMKLTRDGVHLILFIMVLQHMDVLPLLVVRSKFIIVSNIIKIKLGITEKKEVRN